MRTGGWADGRKGGWRFALGLLLSLYPAIRLSAQCPDGTPPPCRQPARAAIVPNSVAVLYFDNLSADTADAYLADGLTDEIIARLGQIERLKVKSRMAVARYRTTTLDPSQLGRALSVGYLVNGTVRRGAARLRVTVELLRATNGNRVWGQQYDRTDADLLAIEEDIGSAVVTAIAGRLAPAERASLAARPTRSPAAYDHFLRGNYALAQRSEAGLASAIAEHQVALQLDSTFTAALSGIAYAYALYLNAGWTVPGLPAESLLSRGMALADHALAQDSASSDAWMTRGLLLEFRNPLTFRGVREAFERSIALNPENAEAHHQFGTALLRLGEDSAAEAAFRRALALDPTRPVTLRNIGWLRLSQRAYTDALRWVDSALVADSTFVLAHLERARLERFLGNVAGVRRDADALARFATTPGTRRLAEDARVWADAAAGDTLAARARAERLFQEMAASDSARSSLGFRDRAYLALALVAAGEVDQALSTLALGSPSGLLLWPFLRSPEFDVIRDQPRFQRLVEEIRPSR